ncbi:MAG: protein-L-isoaspartate(D-aspartate) O-methyltransferase [Saprospiraceae bacterium]|nr:protein-L-isoaspartate(D-aspartate) O-methyltransferase [Saprospiraceae bacterium]
MRSFEDNYRQKGLRRKLIEHLKEKGIKSHAVLDAMLKIPRHLFLDKAFEEWAYKDFAFPIDCDQTISQPFTVARQSELMDIRPKDKVLEIGLGSGYQACVLHNLEAKVYSIERHKTLHDKTSHRLKGLGYSSIRTFYGDGFQGLPLLAPFDKILITAACDEIPEILISQLKEDGFIIFPYGKTNDSQIMTKITKLKNGVLKTEEFGLFRFVPMLKGKV